MSEKEKSSLSTESYKGVRDFYPEDMATLNYIFGVWRKTCESFGYIEYGASILEPSELYRAKSSEEIVSEQTYSFTDRGGREVTLRPEMTPTVARMIAGKRREISLPVRWYSIPNLFRYERPQRGRLREHFQLNADIFGVSSIEADVEMILLAHTLMKNFGLTDRQFEIRINSRKLLQLQFEGKLLSPDLYPDALRLIDKKDKLSSDAFDDLWKKISNAPFEINSKANEEINGLLKTLGERGVPNAVYDPTLARGFDYYSDIVFEIYDTNPKNTRALFGGGRYDGLVSLFGQDHVPAVGFGMGDVTILDALETYGLLPSYRPTTDLYICLLGLEHVGRAEEIATELRSAGLRVAVDLSGKKLADQIKKADKDRVPFIIAIGEEEIKSGTYKLKELKSGEEKTLSLSEIPGAIRD